MFSKTLYIVYWLTLSTIIYRIVKKLYVFLKICNIKYLMPYTLKTYLLILHSLKLSNICGFLMTGLSLFLILMK